MQNRFKFRVWDSVDCEYIEDSDVIRLTQYGKFVFNNATNNTEPELNHKRFIFEQCTGLKDKNGRLIYEGDIVKFENETSEVKWRINGFAIDDGIQYLVEDMDIEVIGNIHTDKKNT